MVKLQRTDYKYTISSKEFKEKLGINKDEIITGMEVDDGKVWINTMK